MDSKLSGLGCLNVEMESSALYTVCHRRKKRAAMISAVSGNLVTGDVIYENVNEGLVKGWDEEIKIVFKQFIVSSKNCRQKLFKSQFTFNSF